MALVGQVATVAQLVGVDAYGLITMIAEAAITVRRNRATCRQLARRVEMIGDLLRQLHAAQATVAQRPETRRPVDELEETLRRAYLLVRSCQRRGYMYRCFMGTRHADELREVQGEIGFYLQLFPLVSYVDATLAWAKLLSKADDPSCQEEPMEINIVLLTYSFVIVTMNNYLASTLFFEWLARAQLLVFCVRLEKFRYTHMGSTVVCDSCVQNRITRFRGLRRNCQYG